MAQKFYDDSNKEQFKFNEDSFELVQADKKIHDVKFETKPTTFAKDAFKRFVKNKSSVVGAIIIGIIILFAIILPVAIPYDISQPHTDQAFLPPKLFNAGFGFWDGTKNYTDIVYDPLTETPAGFSKDGIVKYTNERDGEYVNMPTPNATGGYLHIRTEQKLGSGDNQYDNPYFFRHRTKISISADDNFVIKYTLGDTDNLNNEMLATYRVILKSSDGTIVLKDWSKDFGEQEINVSEILKQKNITKANGSQISFELARGKDKLSYLLLKEFNISSLNEDEKYQETINAISFKDANKTALLNRTDSGQFPVGYWETTATKHVYKAAVKYVSFVYDEYAAKLGTRKMLIGGSDIKKYVNNGWIEYDFEVGPESFKVLNPEKSPVLEVYGQTYDESLGFYNIDSEVVYYKYLGYNSMPRYLFGTTDQGKDLVKTVFNGLRTSLLISLIASIICFAFGLCWGAISGYFGGSVDIFMERFCEILGGVPWIVVMTLAILLLGNNVFTFCIGLCLTGWLGVAARTRTQFYRFKGREYVLASRTLGASDKRLIFRHILPNALGTIVTSSILMIPSTMFSEATLSYLNLGLQGVDSFGVILSENQKYLSTYPALILLPAVIISLLMISFNLFGNGLRDALNPSLKGSE